MGARGGEFDDGCIRYGDNFDDAGGGQAAEYGGFEIVTMMAAVVVQSRCVLCGYVSASVAAVAVSWWRCSSHMCAVS